MTIFSWIQGYLSGMNGMLFTLKRDPTAAMFDLQAMSADEQWAYIVAYCRLNPGAAIVTGVMELAGKHLMRPSK